MSRSKKILFVALDIILVLLVISVVYFIFWYFSACSSAKDRYEGFDFAQNPEYIACSQDSDCMVKSCGCLNKEYIKKFDFITKSCLIFFECEPPAGCTCENSQCQGNYGSG